MLPILSLFVFTAIAFSMASENAVFEDSNFKAARQAMEEQNFTEAVKLLSEVNLHYPQHPAVLDHLAYSYLKLNMNDDAIVTYRNAFRAAAKSSVVSEKSIAKMWSNLGLAYAQQEKHSEALAAYQKAVELMPDDAKTWQRLGQTYLKLGQEDQALEAYERAVQIEPHAYQMWLYLGAAYVQKGQTDQAFSAYQKAVQLNSNSSDAWQKLGELYLKLKRTREANDAFEKASQLSSKKNVPIWADQEKQEKESPRIAPYLKALQLNPQDIGAWQNLAQAYMREKKADHAAAIYSRALWLWGGDLDDEDNELLAKNRLIVFRLLHDLGDAYYASGEFKESIETWKRAIQVLTHNGKQKNAGDSGEVERLWYRIGMAYEKQKKSSQALGAYRKVTSLNPNYANAWKRLAVIYKQHGNKDAAKKAYKQYKKLMKSQ